MPGQAVSSGQHRLILTIPSLGDGVVYSSSALCDVSKAPVALVQVAHPAFG